MKNTSDHEEDSDPGEEVNGCQDADREGLVHHVQVGQVGQRLEALDRRGKAEGAQDHQATKGANHLYPGPAERGFQSGAGGLQLEKIKEHLIKNIFWVPWPHL